MKVFYSPLRYPGGKGKVSNYFKKIIEENRLFDSVYIEPYAGGASVGLSLLFNEYVSKIVINDIDLSIYSFWYSILNETEKFCKMIEETPLDIGTWRKQKEIQNNKEKYSDLEIGFSTFYLNRTNRSGILNAGIIGGLKQDGKWKMDARFKKNKLISKIKKIALYKDRIEVYNLDAITLIRLMAKKQKSNCLFYLDPPYYVKGKDLYLNFYNYEDHKKIAKEINKVKKQKWVVTYDNVGPIRELYKNNKSLFFTLNYSAGKTTRGEEIMIHSKDLIMPPISEI